MKLLLIIIPFCLLFSVDRTFSKQLKKASSQKCPRNEQFVPCGGCDKTCESVRNNQPVPCPAMCKVSGDCLCKQGFVRHKGRCVTRNQCPKSGKRKKIKGVNPCGNKPCKAGQKCVPSPKDCFTTPCPQYDCINPITDPPVKPTCVMPSLAAPPPGCTWVSDTDSNGCPGNWRMQCETRDPTVKPCLIAASAADAGAPAGVPPPGCTWVSDTDSNGCQFNWRMKCRNTKTCKANEIFSECGGCDQPCESVVKNEMIACSMVCAVDGGCTCKPGFARYNGNCVANARCKGLLKRG